MDTNEIANTVSKLIADGIQKGLKSCTEATNKWCEIMEHNLGIHSPSEEFRKRMKGDKEDEIRDN